MLISEFIQQLQDLCDNEGDMEIVIVTGNNGLGPGGPHDCSEEFPLLRRLKDPEKLKALIEILKGDK